MLNHRSSQHVPAVKPSLAVPAVVLALSLTTGNVIGEYADGNNWKWLTALVPAMGILALINPTSVGLTGAGFAAGVAAGCLKNSLCAEEPAYSAKDLTLSGRVISASPGRYGNTDLMVHITEVLSRRKEKVRFMLNLSWREKKPPDAGSRIRVRTGLKNSYTNGKHGKVVRGKPAEDDLVSGPDSLFKAGEAKRRVKLALDGREEPVSGLLAAISLGHRWEVDGSLRRTLRKTGTYHIMAVSGVHVGSALVLPVILVSIIMAGFSVDMVGWKKILPMMAGLLTLSFYLSMTGLSTSALRAGIFVAFYWAAIIVGRYPQPIGVLGWCVVLIVCFSSGGKPDMALFLSASAVTGILMAGAHPCRRPFKVLQVTIGAVLFTLPLSVWCAGGISVLAPICNLLTAAVFGFILIPLAVFIDLMAFISIFPLEPLVDTWIQTAMVVVAVWKWFADLPPSFLPLSHAGCLAAAVLSIPALVTWKNRDFKPGAGTVLFLVVVIASGGFECAGNSLSKGETALIFPRVGQADAAILKGDGRTVLIDCAAAGLPGHTTALERHLVRMGVTGIDALFLTHAHPDHTGGFQDLAERWKIDTLYLPEFEREPGRWSEVLESLKKGTQIVSLEMGDRVRIGPFRFHVHGPEPRGWKALGENAKSLQLSVKWDNMTALFTGDAPWEQVISALEKMTFLELIKIPHHGSKTGFPPEGLASILKRLRGRRRLTAVFPSPPPGDAPLPSRDVVHWFEKQGARCLFTGHGTGLTFITGNRSRVPGGLKYGFKELFDP
jgi:competence protein ComEC